MILNEHWLHADKLVFNCIRPQLNQVYHVFGDGSLECIKEVFCVSCVELACWLNNFTNCELFGNDCWGVGHLLHVVASCYWLLLLLFTGLCFHRLLLRNVLESLTTLIPSTVCGNTLTNASTCGKPSAIWLPPPSVEFPSLHAGDATSHVLPSNISGRSHRVSEL